MRGWFPYVAIAVIAGCITLLFLNCHSKGIIGNKIISKTLKGLNAGMSTRIQPVSTDLDKAEQDNADKCIKNQPKDFKEGHGKFWTGDTQFVRHTHHKYLNNKSIILDVGGNIGKDAEAMFKAYNPKLYIILESVEVYYKKLVNMFENNKEVILYQIGLAKENGEFKVEIKGGATSAFLKKKGKGGVPLKTVSATNFFINIGLGFYDVDLITVNCEGCEFDVLEALTSSTLINHFKHVQFATHMGLPGLKNAVSRYCKIQELLARTHFMTYQYKFTWETWARKDQAK